MATPASIRLIGFAGHDDSPDHDWELEVCRAIRRTVFIHEQGVPESLEWDGLDLQAHHFLALGPVDAAEDLADQTQKDARVAPPQRDSRTTPTPLGTARMRIVAGRAKAERVAVVRSARQHGVGRLLMLALEAHARRLGLPTVLLHAQVTAIPFYERLGYRAHGEIFLDAGIDHREMTKSLV